MAGATGEATVLLPHVVGDERGPPPDAGVAARNTGTISARLCWLPLIAALFILAVSPFGEGPESDASTYLRQADQISRLELPAPNTRPDSPLSSPPADPSG